MSEAATTETALSTPRAGAADLAPQHAELLRASAITAEVAAARGYRTVQTRAELRRLGFSDGQARVPALLVPVYTVHGEIGLYQIRPDQPRIVKGKALKYETPRGARMVLDVPPFARDKLGNPSVPLLITEGVRKADAAVSGGLCCVALLGVWNFRGSNQHAGKVGLADWELVALNDGRAVYIVFDSDVMEKHAVHAALTRLKAFLESRRATVRVIYLPPTASGGKNGLDDFLAAGGTVEQLLALATDELRGLPPAAGPSGKAAKAKPVIQLVDSEWNDNICHATQAVRGIVFMRDTVPMLLRSIEPSDGRTIEGASDIVEISGVRHPVGAMMLMDATPGRVRYQLDERVRFEKFSKREEGWLPTRCPPDIAAQLVANANEMGFPACAGIVHVPLFVEGDIVNTPGWHSFSKLILDVDALPGVADRPTREDAARARARLLRPFRGFDGAVDQCALTAAVLTAVLRPSLRTAPAILLDGNGPGVGKGLLARALSVLATDGTPAVITEGHNAEETEKRIAAALLSGVPVVLLDNLQRHVASSALESALTEGIASIRVFGELRNLRVLCRALVLLTANNATLRRDMLRRTIPVRIVVPVENPEERAFDFDPVAEVRRDRAALIAAALTIARAWWHVRHEHRQHDRALGSFSEWAHLVAGAVAWLDPDHRNPITLIEARKAQDPHAGAERALIEAIAERYGDRRWKAAEAAKDIALDLWAEVMPRLEHGASPTANAVGYWLRQRRDRVFARWALSALDDRTGVNQWCLRPAVIAGDAGHAGDDPPRTGADGSSAQTSGFPSGDCTDTAISSDSGQNIPPIPSIPSIPGAEVTEI